MHPVLALPGQLENRMGEGSTGTSQGQTEKGQGKSTQIKNTEIPLSSETLGGGGEVRVAGSFRVARPGRAWQGEGEGSRT